MSLLAFVGQNEQLVLQLERLAETSGFEVQRYSSPAEVPLEPPPAVIVVELELAGAIEAIAKWKKEWPACLVAGAIRLPIQELWHSAIASGCDLVSNWGALPNQLEGKLEAYRVGEDLVRRAERLKVMLNENRGDGLVGRLPDAPDGPIAVFRIGDQLCAFRDVCPHEGASLADGELVGDVVTCPLHGSRFNVCSGSRLRGPADYPIRTYRVVHEGDSVFVEI